MSDKPKRTAGRPKELPDGKRTNIKCILVNGEHEKLTQAMAASGMSQLKFTRASVLHAADTVLGIVPATPKPKRKK